MLEALETCARGARRRGRDRGASTVSSAEDVPLYSDRFAMLTAATDMAP